MDLYGYLFVFCIQVSFSCLVVLLNILLSMDCYFIYFVSIILPLELKALEVNKHGYLPMFRKIDILHFKA